jgi:hypothetical protein
MNWSGVVAVVCAVFPWILVAWELVPLECVVWKFEKANFLVLVGFLVGWQVFL